jgi:two-component sensor histidine kinase
MPAHVLTRTRPPITLVTVLVPLAAIVVSNLDVAVLTLVRPDSSVARLNLGVWATIPMSVLVGTWTYTVIRRMQRQMTSLIEAEAAMQRVAREREHALANLGAALAREVSLRKELDHRVRNNLAGLVGLVGLYEESGRSGAQLADAIRAKIAALGEVYRIINSTGVERIGLRALLESILDGLAAEAVRPRVRMLGPDVTLSSGEASAVAMIAQELFTNAFKHGALSPGAPPDARVDVAWECRPERGALELDLHWAESRVRGPAREPSIRGVGLPLIEGLAHTDLRGSVCIQPSDTLWRVDVRARLTPAPAPDRALNLQETRS